MITESEKQSTLLSVTAKDFYQIWNDIIETAGKISERWDVTSTNESDPGIVLLKVLTAMGDKLNYNIDKNTLEAFMPSAAQEESMRKLCDMLGYAMKYYRSAVTDVTIAYSAADEDWADESNITGDLDNTTLILPKYTQFTNVDNNIVYTSLTECRLTRLSNIATISCIEGTLNYCAGENNNIVTIDNIDDNFRYYLPSTQIAENGIFVHNIFNGLEDDEWRQVDNLNSQQLGDKVYKFGYDSKTLVPYLQFPEDVSNLIQDGLTIGYIMTNGLNGNISPNTLTSFIIPSEWNSADISYYNTTGKTHAIEEFTCTNNSAATNGENKESLNKAYINFKKTVGTFDTLVTCRDYMNKIYQLTMSETDTTPVVSNIVVSDIRDDINNANILCSFDDYGICYIDQAAQEPDYDIMASSISPADVGGEAADFPGKILYVPPLDFYISAAEDSTYDWYKIPERTHDGIDHFDLMLYPFKTLNKLYTKAEYDSTFKFDNSADTFSNIIESLDLYKTISHKLNLPEENDIVCIKNYLKLNAKITTITKVNSVEWSDILSNIKKAIYTAFNARELDFKEAIPFDDILYVIQNADTNIKNVSLEEPSLYSAVLTKENKEYLLYSDETDDIVSDFNAIIAKLTPEEMLQYKGANRSSSWITNNKILKAKEFYNKLTLRNVLAGRVELFNYDKNFMTNITELKTNNYELIYPASDDSDSNIITALKPNLTLTNTNKITDGFKLDTNQIVQFRAPNFRSIKTYPAYVNYYLHLIEDVNNPSSFAIPATMQTLYTFITENNGANYAALYMAYGIGSPDTETIGPGDEQTFNKYINIYGYVIKDNSGSYIATKTYDAAETYYVYKLTASSFGNWNTFVQTTGRDGLYRNFETNLARPIGKQVDENHTRYIICTSWSQSWTPSTLWVPKLWPSTENTDKINGVFVYGHTADGLGKDAVDATLKANCEYQLKDGEYLCINYTDAQTSVAEPTEQSAGSTLKSTSEVINEYYGKDTIIRPNFALTDSQLKHDNTQTRWSKETGYNFEGLAPSTIRIDGMYSLGANEQIEIREPVVVNVYSKQNSVNSQFVPVYVYFNLNNEVEDSEGNIVFLKGKETNKVYSRILEEGEYFWYTDKNKQTLTYCGSGCEVFNYNEVPIQKAASAAKISADNILTQGLSIIPWIPITGLFITDTKDWQPDPNTDKYIQWREYQYITLSSGDKLNSITLKDEDDLAITTLDNNWVKCTDANYTFSTDAKSTDLPSFSISIDEKDLYWEAHTKLAININNAISQTLKTSDSDPNSIGYTESVTIIYNDDESNNTVAVSDASIKANYGLNSSLDTIQTVYNLYDKNGDRVAKIDDFKLKVFKQNEIYLNVTKSNKEALQLATIDEYYSVFNFSTLARVEEAVASTVLDPFTKLYCAFDKPGNEYGLLMIYYSTIKDTPANYPTITISSETDPITYIPPKIFNFGDPESWWTAHWTDPAGVYRYRLRPGINIVKIESQASISDYIINIYPAIGENEDQKITNDFQDNADTIIFGQLDVINNDSNNGLNQEVLKYFAIDKSTPAEQLLEDIRKVDINHLFYYNAIINKGVAIDLNTDANETMASCSTLYDYNNVNNKFVISEIDSDYLGTGIALAKSSMK